MRKGLSFLFIIVLIAAAHAQTPCPGYNPNHNDNLACEIATATRTTFKDSPLAQMPTTLAAQLSQLPAATAVSGSGVTIGRTGLPTASSESLGTILTRRGETLGRHKFMLSFTYQRFGFGSVDGVRLKDIHTVVPTGDGSFVESQNRLDLRVDQFTAIGTFGLTNRVDIAVIVPFSNVHMTTTAVRTLYSPANNFQPIAVPAPNGNPAVVVPGSAAGPGDVTFNLKVNAFTSQSEKTALAVGTEFRIPSGDKLNYLGTGAYSLKPYFIASHKSRRFTPNINIGYQWNSKSALYTDPTGQQELNLPASFLYSGGADFRLSGKITLVGEFVGQYIINGPRLSVTSDAFGSVQTPAGTNRGSVIASNGSYPISDAGFGIKFSPIRRLMITASALFKLDDGGMRSKVVPLAGIAYRF